MEAISETSGEKRVGVVVVTTPKPPGFMALALRPACQDGCGKPLRQTPLTSMVTQLLTPPPLAQMPKYDCADTQSLNGSPVQFPAAAPQNMPHSSASFHTCSGI